MKKFLACLFMAAGISLSAQAASVAVGNHSFEDPVLAAGGWSDATPPSWNESVLNGANSFTEYINGFAAEGTQHQGTQGAESLWQVLGVAWAPNTNYTLTVASGNRAGFTTAGGITQISLESSNESVGASLASAQVDPATHSVAGAFADFSLLYSTGAVAPTGTIRIVLTNAGAGRSHFDNVRLDASPIPEPSVLGLAGLSALALGRRRRSSVRCSVFTPNRVGNDGRARDWC